MDEVDVPAAASSGDAAGETGAQCLIPEQVQDSLQDITPIPGARNYGYPDDFMMYAFKVDVCKRLDKHPRGSCPFAHPGDVARRRHPSSYQALLCPEIRAKKVCPRLDECQCSHSAFEFWLHPDRYRTSMCEKGMRCNRPVCFFAHTPQELRPLPAGLKPAVSESSSKASHGATSSTSEQQHHQQVHPQVASLQGELPSGLGQLGPQLLMQQQQLGRLVVVPAYGQGGYMPAVQQQVLGGSFMQYSSGGPGGLPPQEQQAAIFPSVVHVPTQQQFTPSARMQNMQPQMLPQQRQIEQGAAMQQPGLQQELVGGMLQQRFQQMSVSPESAAVEPVGVGEQRVSAGNLPPGYQQLLGQPQPGQMMMLMAQSPAEPLQPAGPHAPPVMYVAHPSVSTGNWSMHPQPMYEQLRYQQQQYAQPSLGMALGHQGSYSLVVPAGGSGRSSLAGGEMALASPAALSLAGQAHLPASAALPLVQPAAHTLLPSGVTISTLLPGPLPQPAQSSLLSPSASVDLGAGAGGMPSLGAAQLTPADAALGSAVQIASPAQQQATHLGPMNLDQAGW